LEQELERKTSTIDLLKKMQSAANEHIKLQRGMIRDLESSNQNRIPPERTAEPYLPATTYPQSRRTMSRITIPQPEHNSSRPRVLTRTPPRRYKSTINPT